MFFGFFSGRAEFTVIYRVTDIEGLAPQKAFYPNPGCHITSEWSKVGLMRRACARTPSPRSFLLPEQSLQATPSPFCDELA